MKLQVEVERVVLAHKAVRAELLAERTRRGHWVGQLASSPLATAAAISALVSAHRRDTDDTLRESLAGDGQVVEQLVQGDLCELLLDSVHWLARHQNADGGWGDCDTAQSNLAATMLVQAAFRMTGVPAKYADLIVRADEYISDQGGAASLRRSHVNDKAFVAGVLTHCALAGTVAWRQVPTLPFELVCLPKRWRQYIQFPYPRYSSPALIAVGRLKFHHDPPRNPLTRLLRRSMRAKSLAILEALQATDHSFLGSTLLTAFVVTSLASIGCQDHPIVQRGLEFLLTSVRGDASWPIKTDHAITNTALALNSLAVEHERDALRPTYAGQPHGENAWNDTARTDDTVAETVASLQERSSSHGGLDPAVDEEVLIGNPCLDWLLESQCTKPNLLTEAPPGGWAWSDAPGALPNTISTSSALMALAEFWRRDRHAKRERIDRAVRLGIDWLLAMQDEVGGWPTFYGDDNDSHLDPVGTDSTAYALRALTAWQQSGALSQQTEVAAGIDRAIDRGWRYLESHQQADGRFIPLWFGNEHQPGDHNPVYGTAQVLIACDETKRLDTDLARRAAHWMLSAQHSTGGWGSPRAPRDYSGAEKDGFRAWRANDAMAKLCSVEETALAVSALLPLAESGPSYSRAVSIGLMWLAAAVEQDAHRRPAVVGFYPSKIWYHERLYPLVFAAGTFSRAIRQLAPQPHETASAASR